MTLNGICRIDGETSVPKDIGGKLRYLHRVPITFPEYGESACRAVQHQSLQFLPVIETISVMDVLGDVAHNRIGASPQTVGECAIHHHPEILCLVNDHMACLPDAVNLLDPLINIGESRQVIEIK